MNQCNACQAPVAGGELQLTPAGQWLCRRCHATYESMAATRRARRAEVARRCACGNVVSPMGSEERDENGHYYLFQSSVYACSRCGTEYRTHHPVMVATLVAGVSAVVAALRRASDEGEFVLGYVVLLIVASCVGYEVYKWFRYPQVR